MDLETTFKDCYLFVMKKYLLKDHESFVKDHEKFKDIASIRRFCQEQGLDIIIVPQLDSKFSDFTETLITGVSTAQVRIGGLIIDITLQL